VGPVPEETQGQVSYIEIPARDIAESATFYSEVFGWTFVPDYPGSFDTPSGLIGALQTDLPVTCGDGGCFVSPSPERPGRDRRPNIAMLHRPNAHTTIGGSSPCPSASPCDT